MNDTTQSPTLNDEDIGLEVGFSGAAAPDPKLEETDNNLESQSTEHTEQPETPAAAQANVEPATPPVEDDVMTKVKNLIDGRFRNFTGQVNKLMDDKLKAITATDVQAATKAATSQGGDTPSNQQIQAALKDGSKMKALVDEFPEFGEALLESQEINAKQLEQSLLEKLNATKIDESRFASADEVVSLREELVTAKHADWVADINTPEFASWLEAQPADIQALADSTKPRDAITMLDKFYDSRKARGKPDSSASAASSTNHRLASAIQPATSGKAPPLALSDEEDGMEYGFNS